MGDRTWDSQHPDTLYGDAAARVLCRLLGAEPSGRSLQQCLDALYVEPSPAEAARNARNGDGTWAMSDGSLVGVECKASMGDSANVCWSDREMGVSMVGVLAAWVPGTGELCWFATRKQVESAAAGSNFSRRGSSAVI